MTAPIQNLDVLGSAEAQLQKIFVTLQQKELSVPAESRPDNISVIYDLETLTAKFSADNIPIQIVIAGNGSVTITVNAYPSLS
jgi:hypothetical protein